MLNSKLRLQYMIFILNMILIKRESNTYRKPKILANDVPKLENMVNYENVVEAQTDT